MMALGKGVCSDENVHINRPYLARLRSRHFVILPVDPKHTTRTEIPYKEAVYFDQLAGGYKPLTNLHELAPIY